MKIVERTGVRAEEAVRIFLEFKRVESAIKGESMTATRCQEREDITFPFSSRGFERKVFRRSRGSGEVLQCGAVPGGQTVGLRNS